MTNFETFKAKVAFYAFAFLVGVYTIPWFVIALLNPLWFREYFFDLLTDHLSMMERY